MGATVSVSLVERTSEAGEDEDEDEDDKDNAESPIGRIRRPRGLGTEEDTQSVPSTTAAGRAIPRTLRLHLRCGRHRSYP